MRFRSALMLLGTGFATWGVLHAQRPFQEYPGVEYENFPLPPDWKESTEWTRARLRYPSLMSVHGRRDGYRRWTVDYPRSDRHLLQGVRRLTRIDTRSVEQVVDLDGTDDIYNWPMLYAVEVGHWLLPDDQAAQLREYLLRGGMLMVDDFHGSEYWSDFRGSINELEVFVARLSKVFPDRPIVDIPNDDPIFHTVYDLDDRFQVPGAQYLWSGLTYEKGPNGKPEQWRD